MGVPVGWILGENLGLDRLPSIMAQSSTRLLVIGGILVGICESLAGTYIEPLGLIGFKNVAPYMLLLIVLFIRPYGLFGTVRIERV